MNHLSTAQLATYLKVTKRTIQRRAIRESWPYIIQASLGGKRRMYEFASLSADVKLRVMGQIIAKHEQQGANYSPAEPVEQSAILPNNPFIAPVQHNGQGWLSQHIFAEQFPHPLDVVELNKEYIKTGLLVLVQLYIMSFGLGKIKSFDEFCHLYNNRELALKQEVFGVVNKVSRITLLRWEKQFQQHGEQSLLVAIENEPQYWLDRDLAIMAQELLMSTPKLTAKRLRQYFLTVFPDRTIPSERKLSAWLTQQKSQVQAAIN